MNTGVIAKGKSRDPLYDRYDRDSKSLPGSRVLVSTSKSETTKIVKGETYPSQEGAGHAVAQG